MNGEWEKARVIRTDQGVFTRGPSGWWLDAEFSQYGTSDIDDMAWVRIVIDAYGVNVEMTDLADWCDNQAVHSGSYVDHGAYRYAAREARRIGAPA